MLRMMGRDAQAIYLLGDMLDFWFEYKYVVPKGHLRFFAELTRLVDSGVKVYWFKGNHDMWTMDYLSKEVGVEVVDESMTVRINGRTFYLNHGDGLGKLPMGFRIVRKIFRNSFCQRLGRALHPSWLMSFGFKWSSHNRCKRGQDIETYQGDENEQQMQYAIQYCREHPETDFFINGHRHVTADVPIPGSHARLICLGDCFRQFTYAVFDGNTLALKHYDTKKV